MLCTSHTMTHQPAMIIPPVFEVLHMQTALGDPAFLAKVCMPCSAHSARNLMMTWGAAGARDEQPASNRGPSSV